jgi:hypothetical protein
VKKKRKPTQCRHEAHLWLGHAQCQELLRCVGNSGHRGPHQFVAAIEPPILVKMDQIAIRCDLLSNRLQSIYEHVSSMHGHMHDGDEAGVELKTPQSTKDKPS